MIGCELLEDGSTTGFLLYAYDGQDFIIFNKDTLSWMAVDNVAHITKQAWEANWHELQYQKNWQACTVASSFFPLLSPSLAWPKLMSCSNAISIRVSFAAFCRRRISAG